MDPAQYHLLVRSISVLQQKWPPSDDWEQIHYNFFCFICKKYPHLSCYRPDISDDSVRLNLSYLEMMCSEIQLYFEDHGTMPYEKYCEFLEGLHAILDFIDAEDELATQMSTLGV